MRIGTGDEFLRLTGGAMTGPLTITANTSPLITVNRPDGTAYGALRSLVGGVFHWELAHYAAEPYLRVDDGAAASRLTVRTDTGLLGASLIPLSLLRVDEQTAQNAGAVTVLAAATTIASLGSMTVAVGDRILVTARVSMLKGATAGVSGMLVQQTAGTATIVMGVDHTQPFQAHDQLNATTHDWVMGLVFRVTGAGTLTLSVQGTSAGSNGTVGIGAGELHALVLRG